MTNLSASSNVYGVRLWESNNIAVYYCSFTYNKYGISLSYSNTNTIAYNTVSNNSYIGAKCTYSSNNTLNHNRISSNFRWGLSFHDSDWNTVVGNTIRDNIFLFISWGGGFGLENGYGNIVCHNNFIRNSPHEAIEYNGGENLWDDGLEGNYWSDYTGRDLDGDGIGDEHLPWHGDYYPIINPYILGDINHDAKVDIYDIVLAAGAYGSTPSDPNWNPHCDIAEPYRIIDIFDIVMIAGNYGKSW